MKNKWIRWILVLGVLAALALPKLLKKDGQDGTAAGKTGKGPAGPVPVQGMLIRLQTIENKVKATGTLLAWEEVDLQSETSGKVVKIFFEEGKPVRKGQLLLKINDADPQAQLRKAESKLHLAEEMEKKEKELLKKEGISQVEYDVSLHELNASKAEVAQLREMIRKTEVIAPFDGTVGLKYISEGAYVTPSSRIATLQNVQQIKVEFAIPERYIALVKTGGEISFRCGGSDKTYHAKIYAVEPRIDAATRNAVLRAICRNDGTLYPGSFVNIDVELAQTPDAIMIPTETVIPVLKGQKVFVVKGDSVVERKIETGVRTDKMIQVKSGIADGDTLITTAIMQLRQGSKVTVVKLTK